MTARPVTLFLCGDVMTGRGVDQILPHPNAPNLQESWVRDARDYVAFAEKANGGIPHPVAASYIWGDALDELDRIAPDVRIINLETSVTTSDTYLPGKPIHYRMNPSNVVCLSAAHIDICVLANNHLLDYGGAGLAETLDTLHEAGIKTAGAGYSLAEAQRPATVELPGGGRVVVFSLGSEDSGVPADWSATDDHAGVDYLPDFSRATADRVVERVREVTDKDDLVVASIHWGGNWGYEVPRAHVEFAHRLLDGGVAVVHGHSSHHPRPIEIYDGKLVLYGCGDFLSDYEGIGGYEAYRGDLPLMYFPTLDGSTGELLDLRLVPMRLRRMQATSASAGEAEWLRDLLTQISAPFGTRTELSENGVLEMHVRAEEPRRGRSLP